MNCLKNIGKLYPLLIGLIAFQSSFLYLTESSSLLHTDNASSAILQQSPIHHNHATHLLGIFELGKEEDRSEKNNFLRADLLRESTTEEFSIPQLPLLGEKHLLSVGNLPVYLVNEQFRL